MYTLFYSVNAHAEDLRHILVAHEGQKTLEVVSLSPDNRYTADFGWFTKEMGDLLRTQVRAEILQLPADSKQTRIQTDQRRTFRGLCYSIVLHNH